MARRILWGTLALTPIVLLSRYVVHVGETTQFVLAAAALIPLAWLIGEATDKASAHTGPGLGGFLNASFGNAPELIIALFAIADGLPTVVRGSIAGSVVSNMLLVLGAAMIFGGNGSVDARSLRWQSFGLLAGVGLLLVPSIAGWSSGTPNSHDIFLVTIPVAIVLLLGYAWLTIRNLRIHSEEFHAEPSDRSWSLRTALVVLSVATVATALVSEALVHSLHAFGEAVGLSEFFIAVVIVALVGNAAEHGGAIVIASRGNTNLATEIAITSSMQVGLLVAPAVAVLSLFLSHNLTLAFRPVEIATMAGAGILAWLVTRDGRSSRGNGIVLAGAYVAAVAAYALFP